MGFTSRAETATCLKRPVSAGLQGAGNGLDSLEISRVRSIPVNGTFGGLEGQTILYEQIVKI